MNLRPEQQFLLTVPGNTLSAERKKSREALPQDLDWEYVRRQARIHRVGPLLWYACLAHPEEYGHIPSEIRQDFQEQYQQTYLQNTLLYQQLDRLLHQLAEDHIVPVFLKGIFLAKWVYGNIGLRPMRDIDLLLADRELQIAEQTLERAGYTSILQHLTFVSDWQKAHEEALFFKLKYQGCHLPQLIKTFGAFQVVIELHHALMSTMRAQNVQTVDIPHNGGVVRTLRPEYFLLHLCFHLHSHAIEGKLPLLIWHYDLLKFLNMYAACFDWSLLFSLAEQFQAHEVVVTRLAQACRLFDYPLPAPLRCAASAGDLSQKFWTALFPEREPSPDRQFISSVFKVRTFSMGVRYLWECLFPSREFLRQRYQVRHNWLVYGYYPLRLWKAFRRGTRLIKYLLAN